MFAGVPNGAILGLSEIGEVAGTALGSTALIPPKADTESRPAKAGFAFSGFNFPVITSGISVASKAQVTLNQLSPERHVPTTYASSPSSPDCSASARGLYWNCSDTTPCPVWAWL